MPPPAGAPQRPGPHAAGGFSGRPLGVLSESPASARSPRWRRPRDTAFRVQPSEAERAARAASGASRPATRAWLEATRITGKRCFKFRCCLRLEAVPTLRVQCRLSRSAYPFGRPLTCPVPAVKAQSNAVQGTQTKTVRRNRAPLQRGGWSDHPLQRGDAPSMASRNRRARQPPGCQGTLQPCTRLAERAQESSLSLSLRDSTRLWRAAPGGKRCGRSRALFLNPRMALPQGWMRRCITCNHATGSALCTHPPRLAGSGPRRAAGPAGVTVGGCGPGRGPSRHQQEHGRRERVARAGRDSEVRPSCRDLEGGSCLTEYFR